MGFVKVLVRLYAPDGGQGPAEVEALVDTGAIFSVIPGGILRGIGVQPEGVKTFHTFAGGAIEREVGAVSLEVQGTRSVIPVPVNFGLEQDEPVLGVTALEILGLEVDPVRGELRPTRFLLL